MTTLEKQYAIPRFYLYGEADQHHDAEFVHIEFIETRSERERWRIRPHRHGKVISTGGHFKRKH